MKISTDNRSCQFVPTGTQLWSEDLIMINRRSFLGLAGAGVLVFGSHATAGEQKAFRTISYNVLAFRGFPDTHKTHQRIQESLAQHPELTAKALAAFAPDIVTLQEGPSEDIVARFAKELGMNYAYFAGGWEGDSKYPGGFPGAVVTRFEILESKNRPSAGAPHDEALFTRHLGYAKLGTPFGILYVVSTHFHASEHEIRMQEASAIIDFIATLRANGSVLLQGDLNHRPEDPEHALLAKAGLIDIGEAMGIGNQPTASSIRPRSRIDYIWSTPELAGMAQSAMVLDKPPFIPETDVPSSYALSDHLPVMAEFLVKD